MNTLGLKNLFIKVNGILKRIPIHSIHWIETKSRKVSIHTENDHFTSNSSLKKFNNILSETAMMRIHKSYIVNLNKLTNIKFDEVQLPNTTIFVGRSYVDPLKKRINEFTGTK